MSTLKALRWVGSAKKDLAAMPDDVQDVFGYALYLAQLGDKHRQAVPLTGFGGAGVLEVAEKHLGNAYRAVYTVRFITAVFVLHCFQKKSTRGIATPKKELDLVKARLVLAAAMNQDHLK
jgi:phage-related protein